MSCAVVVAALLSHAAGFHERVSIAVSRQNVDGLLVMDVDAGEQAKLIRAGADVNRDGALSAPERGALQKKLVAMATGSLKLGLSGFALTLAVTDVKLSTRNDDAVSESGLSLAVMLAASVKSPIGEGIKLEVEATSPDSSHVLVEVSASRPDAGVEAVEKRELAAGEKWAVRVGALGRR
ncbi:MAG: hypothetical protein JNK82_00775 [Myxococcaceae bacterium]|nr:hypothetical protein [Myxococcaceae bacterium]